MKIIIRYVFAFIILFAFSCKEKEVFVEPDLILKKWAEAAANLNYKEYSMIEAYPKTPRVFAESFREFYPHDVRVLKIEKINQKQVYEDHNSDSYHKRNVQFEFTQINRSNRRTAGRVFGDVDFVRFIDGDNEKRGWIMLNRTLIRVYD